MNSAHPILTIIVPPQTECLRKILALVWYGPKDKLLTLRYLLITRLLSFDYDRCVLTFS